MTDRALRVRRQRPGFKLEVVRLFSVRPRGVSAWLREAGGSKTLPPRHTPVKDQKSAQGAEVDNQLTSRDPEGTQEPEL